MHGNSLYGIEEGKGGGQFFNKVIRYSDIILTVGKSSGSHMK